jgi:multisubunit Na+/H+ antiporter MnhB subunit
MGIDPVRETARGRDEATPARALAGVTLLVGVGAVVLIVALLILWYALK